MNLALLKDELSTLERAIKTREREIQRDLATVSRFKQKAEILKEQIQTIESGQLELFNQEKNNE